MSLGRFHGEIKNKYPKNGAVPPNHFIWIIFGIWDNEFQKRINYKFNPKKENMSYRLKIKYIQKELATKRDKFLFYNLTNNIMEVGTSVKY